MVSSILGISVNNLIITWRFIEINLLAFIPLITFRKNFNPHIIGIKYFLVQSLGSIFLLATILIILISEKNNFFNFFFVIRLLWKIGVPPFHFWLFRLIIELNWLIFFILSSWQKILPLYLINKIYFNLWDYIIILSLVVCVIGVVFQSRIKKLIIFSSIFTGSWIISSIIFFKIIWTLLLFLYRIILLFLIIFLLNSNLLEKEKGNYFLITLIEKFYIFFILLRIAGIPPFLGFFIKISVLFILLIYKKFFLSFVLVISSIIILFIYRRIFLNSLRGLTSNRKIIFFQKNYNLFFLRVIFFIGPVIFLVI